MLREGITLLTTSLDLSTIPQRQSHWENGDRYEVQVTVVNPAGQKVTFWRAPIVLVQ